MPANRRSPLALLGLLTSLTLLGCDPGPQQLTLAVVSAGPSPGAASAQDQAADPANRQLVRVGTEVCAAVAASWSTLRPQLAAIRTAQRQHPPATYRLAAVDGWRFFAGGWSHGDDPARTLRLMLDGSDGRLVTWDVSDEESYGEGGQAAFPSAADRLRLDLDELLPSGGRLQVNQFFPLAPPDVGFQIVGRGDVAQAGLLGPLVIEAFQARTVAGDALTAGELVLRARAEGATVQLSADFGNDGMTGGRLMRSGQQLGRILPGLPGQWVLATDQGTHGL